MRDLIVVIDSMLALIPERSVNFRRALEACKETDEYLAPVELTHEHWSATARVLGFYVHKDPRMRQDWMNAIMKVWNGNSE